MLSDAGIYLKEESVVGVSIIEATSSTNNKAKGRYPEMYQAQKAKGTAIRKSHSSQCF